MRDTGKKELDMHAFVNGFLRKAKKNIEGIYPGKDFLSSMQSFEDGEMRRLSRTGAVRMRIFKDE